MNRVCVCVCVCVCVSGCCRRQISAATEGLSDDDSLYNSNTSSAAVLSCFPAQSLLRDLFITDVHNNSNLEVWTQRSETVWLQLPPCFHPAVLAAPRPTHSPAVARESHAVGCILFFGILCGMRVTGFKTGRLQNKQTSICSLLAEVCYSAAFCKRATFCYIWKQKCQLHEPGPER